MKNSVYIYINGISKAVCIRQLQYHASTIGNNAPLVPGDYHTRRHTIAKQIKVLIFFSINVSVTCNILYQNQEKPTTATTRKHFWKIEEKNVFWFFGRQRRMLGIHSAHIKTVELKMWKGVSPSFPFLIAYCSKIFSFYL